MESSGIIAAGDYSLSLAAVPAATSLSAADTLLFAGAGDLYRCGLAGGCSLRDATNATNACATPAGVAPAQHAIAWQLNAGDAAAPRLFFGNDGGIWRSLDSVREQGAACSADDATHFDNLNGGIGSLAEVSTFSSHPSNASTLLVALGANGSAVSTTSAQANASAPWLQLSNGESGTVGIDHATGNTWAVQSGSGVALHTCSGGACTQADFNDAPTIGLAQVSNDASLPHPPVLLDPALNSNVLVGTCRVWRGPLTDGAAWTASNAISHVLGGPTGPSCNSDDAFIRSLAAGGTAIQGSNAQNSGSPVLYAGTAGAIDGGGSFAGRIYTTRSGNTATSTTVWTDLTGNPVSNDLSNRFNAGVFDISSIATDPTDAAGMTVYATVMGFDVPHVYRSLNGGATWTNISANLPNAPANSVAVDPTDARIVYVAMDTGVYAAQDVTSCISASGASIDCWSVMGAALPNAPAISLEISPALTLPGATTQGTLRAGTYGRGIWQIPLLVNAVAAQPVISVSPLSLTFGTQAPGSTSAAQTVTISNVGGGVLDIADTTTSSSFILAGKCIGAALAAGQSCSVQVSFSPAASALVTGELTIASDSNGIAGTQTPVQLNGNGLAEFQVVLVPTSVNFGQQLVGTLSAVTNVTISNTGSATGAVGSITVSGDFRLTANTCSKSLAPQTGCTVSIVFAPTASGSRTGLLTVVDDAGTQIAALRGSGAQGATDTVAPLMLAFAAQQANTDSTLQSVTLTNAGDVPLTLVAAKVLTGDFTAVNGCGPTVAAHSTCAIGVGFAPAGVGTRTGVLQISDVLRLQTIALSGTGIAGPGISLLPTALNFPATGVGALSAGQTLTFTNNSSIPVLLSDPVVTGSFGIVAGSDTCVAGQTVSAGGSCIMSVAFLPDGAGPRIGSVAVPTDGGTRTSQLLGTGVDFNLQSNGPSTLSIHSGDNAVYSLLLRPAIDMSTPVTFVCTGVPVNATCKVNAQYSDLSAVGTVAVTVLTGTTVTSTNSHSLLLGKAAAVLLLMGVPLGLRRSRRAAMSAAVACVLLFATGGCGSGRAIPDAGDGSGSGTGSSNPVTPSGSYVTTVSATAAGITRSVPLTLVVQ